MSKRVLYIHGLGSGVSSNTAKFLTATLGQIYDVYAPEIPHNPYEAIDFIKEVVESYRPDLVIGSSLGGFYTMMISVNIPRILINPAMMPSTDLLAIPYGKYEYYSVRSNGDKYYEINKQFMDSLFDIECLFYEKFNNGSYDLIKENTYGIFGANDELLHHKDDFIKMYGDKKFTLTEAKHQLPTEIMQLVLLPLAITILEK